METWRAVPEFEGYYEVSDAGNVRSVTRRVWVAPSHQSQSGYYRSIRGRALRPSKSLGYRSFSLWRGHELLTARGGGLALAAFVGPRPVGKYVCHLDGDRQNDALENLYYGTPSQNTEDARRHGTMRLGEACAASKLSKAAVAAIRSLKGIEPQSRIAASFGVSQAQISRILRGAHWRDA